MKYTDLFFDLDRTLWDFDRNSRETLLEIHLEFKLAEVIRADFETFHAVFAEKNLALWRELRGGNNAKEELRTRRFTDTIFHFNNQDWKLARKMSQYYLDVCPYKQHLVSGSQEVLDYLTQKYNLHLITNGFGDSQRIKLKESQLEKYFDQVIISDETPYRKPMRAIFNFALEKAQTQASRSVMIGDDLSKDILGAKKAGIDQVYFAKVSGRRPPFKPTYEITDLSELMTLF
ncbi:MAG: YjjG family noncanonical pyrimidine nucleotidase [Vicingaceae bacterium]